MNRREAVVIGGGPAGLAAVIGLKKEGIDDILLLEREDALGGVLNQCIHDGFGLERYGENYSGPEYAALDVEQVKALGVDVHCCAAALSITSGETEGMSGQGDFAEKLVSVVEPSGEDCFLCRAVIVAAGCRERTRGAIEIPGSRPAGIYTAGAAQSFMNLHNLMPGKRIVILGSGDIGLIMARRLTLEGAEVICVVEKEKTPGGLQRNIVQCLDDFEIPLYLDAAIERVYGTDRLTGVDIVQNSIGGQNRWHCRCDTLITSVGLIPENEIIQTEAPGVFVIGNARYVHDLVDQVSQEGFEAAAEAAEYLRRARGCGGESGGQGCDRGQGQDQDRGCGGSQGQSCDWGKSRGQGCDRDQDRSQSCNQGCDQGQNSDRGWSCDRGQGQDRSQSSDRGCDRGQGQAQSCDRNQGQSQGCGGSFMLSNLNAVRQRKAAELAAKKQAALEELAVLEKLAALAEQAAGGTVHFGGSASAERGRELICVLCPKGCRISEDLSGAGCDKGRNAAREELVEKRRTLTTSVKVRGGVLPLVSVRSSRRIPMAAFRAAMEEIRGLAVAAPVVRGQIICEDLAGTGAAVVATKSVECE